MTNEDIALLPDDARLTFDEVAACCTVSREWAIEYVHADMLLGNTYACSQADPDTWLFNSREVLCAPDARTGASLRCKPRTDRPGCRPVRRIERMYACAAHRPEQGLITGDQHALARRLSALPSSQVWQCYAIRRIPTLAVFVGGKEVAQQPVTLTTTDIVRRVKSVAG